MTFGLLPILFKARALAVYRVKTAIIGRDQLVPFIDNVFGDSIKNKAFNLDALNTLGVGFLIHEVMVDSVNKLSNLVWSIRFVDSLAHMINDHVRSSAFVIILLDSEGIDLRRGLEIALNLYLDCSNNMPIFFAPLEESISEALNDLGLVSSKVIIEDGGDYTNILREIFSLVNSGRLGGLVDAIFSEILGAWTSLGYRDFNLYGGYRTIIKMFNRVEKDELKRKGRSCRLLAKLKKEFLNDILESREIGVDKKLVFIDLIHDMFERERLIDFYISVLKTHRRLDVLYEALRGLKRIAGGGLEEILTEILEVNPLLKSLI